MLGLVIGRGLRERVRAAFSIVVLLGCSAALACSSEDRIELATMGYSTAQVNAMCGSGGNPFASPSMPSTRYCVTGYGSCTLGNRVQSGSHCGCPAGNGYWIPGVAH
jgi:hypothetical protein